MLSWRLPERAKKRGLAFKSVSWLGNHIFSLYKGEEAAIEGSGKRWKSARKLVTARTAFNVPLRLFGLVKTLGIAKLGVLRLLVLAKQAHRGDTHETLSANFAQDRLARLVRLQLAVRD